MVASGYQVSFHPVWQPTHLTTRHSGSGSYLLRPAAVKLSVSWARFREKVPNKEAASWQHRAPDFKDVFDLMNNISTQFEDKRKRGPTGLINRYFRQSCEQLKAHDTLLSILPEGSEYVSLFTGVLKSIIKVSELIGGMYLDTRKLIPLRLLVTMKKYVLRSHVHGQKLQKKSRW